MSPRAQRTFLYSVGVACVLAAVAAVVLIGFTRSAQTRAEASRRQSAISAGLRVNVVRATRSPPQRRIELQGEARPFASVTLYSKVSGYLKELRVDRGDKVRANQVLAVIQSPELDRQYEAAKADATFKRANARRAANLAGPGVVSMREAELEKASAEIAEANVSALGTQRGYTILRAPFDGTVTARFADRGALVQNAANGQSGALPVLTVAQIDRLRVLVYVDQRDAPQVKLGDQAEVVAGYDNRILAGKVSRISGELEPRTRTMLVEIHLDNKDHTIVAGSFITVRLGLQLPPGVSVPVDALLLRAQKPFVAVVGADGHVQLRPVQVASDDGAHVHLSGGLKEGEWVALNAGRGIKDGDLVQPIEQKPANAPAAK